MFASDLLKAFWGESIYDSYWLRNILQFSRTDNRIPLPEWNNSENFDFTTVLEIWNHGYSFIYYPQTFAKKKVFPTSELPRFIGMKSDTREIRVFLGNNDICIVLLADFHSTKSNILPSVSSLIDGLSRQRYIYDTTKESDHSLESAELHGLNLEYSSSLQVVCRNFRWTYTTKVI